MPPAQTRCDLGVRIPLGYGPAANRLLENYRVRAGKPPGAIPADDQVNDPGGRRRPPAHADLAELADAQDSGSCARKGVGVRAPRSAPSTYRASGSSRHLGREAEPSSQRVVAQHGSAPRSGRGGRRFESVRPDTMPAGARQPLGDDSLPGAITTAWPSGEAAGCNPAQPGSTPGAVSRASQAPFDYRKVTGLSSQQARVRIPHGAPIGVWSSW